MQRRHGSRIAIALAAALIPTATAHGSLGELAQIPLFATINAEPNIFFLLDDSTSMDWDMVTTESAIPEELYGSTAAGGLMWSNHPEASVGWYYTFWASENREAAGTGSTDDRQKLVVPTQETVNDAGYGDRLPGVWRARNHHYNRLYYNPAETYEPWAGTDAAGNPYRDVDPKAAPIDPFDTGARRYDLTATRTFRSAVHRKRNEPERTIQVEYLPAMYYVWIDTDQDGVVDAEDGYRLVEIKPGNQCGAGQTPASDGCYLRSYQDEIQNFANWFSYHRRRLHAAQYALSKAIDSAQGVRMGMAGIHTDAADNRREIASVTGSAGAPAKSALLRTLFNVRLSEGTPLREALMAAGEYYACDGTNLFGNRNCPVLTEPVAPATEAAGACQQNVAILVTDGYYTDDLTGIGNVDADDHSWSAGGKTYAFGGPPYADARSNTLADVAMRYYARDLHRDLADKVPTRCGIDENHGQHMVTYVVGFGVYGHIPADDLPSHPRLGYAPGCTATPMADRRPFDWWRGAQAAIGDAEKIDDLVHAAFNGRGRYLSADRSGALSAALAAAVRTVGQRSGSAAAVSFNATARDAGSVLYLGLFDASDWSGDLRAYALDPRSGAPILPARWSAAAALDARGSERTIVTHNGRNGVPFRWDDLGAGQKDDLRTGGAGPDDTVAKARLDYLRGDRSNEGRGFGFRVRGSRLGDIVHSSPVLVGAPDVGWNRNWKDGNGMTYADFIAAYRQRTAVVYVGANDGMLHGFRAADGEEVLAYVPGLLASTQPNTGLHFLSARDYSHHYYVDATPAVSDAMLTIDGRTQWRTVLVSGLRGGGRGLFALDVTDPDRFTEASADKVVLWEFARADLGHVFGRPVIARLNDGRWAAIVGNGYNDVGEGQAKLFVIYLDGGLDGVWGSGDYLVFGVGEKNREDRNGLSAPAVVDLDGNGTADRVYAGDLKGNLWVFDLCNATSDGCQASGWGPAYGGEPLFTAAPGQAITAEPTVVNAVSFDDRPTDVTAPQLMVLFGTGQYLTEADKTSTATQSFYGVIDRGRYKLTRADLTKQEVSQLGDLRIVTDHPLSESASSGWYIDLPNVGERVTTSALVRDKVVYVNTMIPSLEPCDSGGSGWLLSVAAHNGGLPKSATFDSNHDGVVDSRDKIAAGKRFDLGLPAEVAILGNRRYVAGTDGVTGVLPVAFDAIPVVGSGRTGRLSWEELVP